MTAPDAITLQLLWSRLIAIVEEQAHPGLDGRGESGKGRIDVPRVSFRVAGGDPQARRWRARQLNTP